MDNLSKVVWPLSGLDPDVNTGADVRAHPLPLQIWQPRLALCSTAARCCHFQSFTELHNYFRRYHFLSSASRWEHESSGRLSNFQKLRSMYLVMPKPDLFSLQHNASQMISMCHHLSQNFEKAYASTGMSARIWRPKNQELILEGKRDGHPSSRREREFVLHLPFCSIWVLSGLDDAHPHG